MNRDDKINALRQLLQGEPINTVFPVKSVTIVERFSESHSLVIAGRDFKMILCEEVKGYLDRLKQENPLKRLEINRVSKQEYDEINERLENEY